MKRRGLTLIELVIALALGALIAVALQTLAVRAYSSHKLVVERDRTARRGELPRTVFEHDCRNRAAGDDFELAGNMLRFRTLMAFQSERAATRHAVEVRYTIVHEDDETVLLRAERELGDQAAWSSPLRLGQAQRIDIAVFDGRMWHSSWPLAIRRNAHAIRLRLSGGDGASGTPRFHESRVRVQPPRWRNHRE